MCGDDDDDGDDGDDGGDDDDGDSDALSGTTLPHDQYTIETR